MPGQAPPRPGGGSGKRQLKAADPGTDSAPYGPRWQPASRRQAISRRNPNPRSLADFFYNPCGLPGRAAFRQALSAAPQARRQVYERAGPGNGFPIHAASAQKKSGMVCKPGRARVWANVAGAGIWRKPAGRLAPAPPAPHHRRRHGGGRQQPIAKPAQAKPALPTSRKSMPPWRRSNASGHGVRLKRSTANPVAAS